jgi:hypothetical protein
VFTSNVRAEVAERKAQVPESSEGPSPGPYYRRLPESALSDHRLTRCAVVLLAKLDGFAREEEGRKGVGLRPEDPGDVADRPTGTRAAPDAPGAGRDAPDVPRRDAAGHAGREGPGGAAPGARRADPAGVSGRAGRVARVVEPGRRRRDRAVGRGRGSGCAPVVRGGRTGGNPDPGRPRRASPEAPGRPADLRTSVRCSRPAPTPQRASQGPPGRTPGIGPGVASGRPRPAEARTTDTPDILGPRPAFGHPRTLPIRRTYLGPAGGPRPPAPGPVRTAPTLETGPGPPSPGRFRGVGRPPPARVWLASVHHDKPSIPRRPGRPFTTTDRAYSSAPAPGEGAPGGGRNRRSPRWTEHTPASGRPGRPNHPFTTMDRAYSGPDLDPSPSRWTEHTSALRTWTEDHHDGPSILPPSAGVGPASTRCSKPR